MSKKLCKSETDKMLFGICGGLENILILALLLFVSFGLLLFYVLGQDF